MGNSESTDYKSKEIEEYTLKFWKVSNASEFYVWCRSLFYLVHCRWVADIISANIYQLLNTFLGYYLIEAFKTESKVKRWYSPIIVIKSNVPYFNKRWDLQDEYPVIDRESLPDLPFYELNLFICVRSERAFSFHFETKAEFLTFLNTPKPIQWPSQSEDSQTDDTSKLKRN